MSFPKAEKDLRKELAFYGLELLKETDYESLIQDMIKGYEDLVDMKSFVPGLPSVWKFAMAEIRPL